MTPHLAKNFALVRLPVPSGPVQAAVEAATGARSQVRGSGSGHWARLASLAPLGAATRGPSATATARPTGLGAPERHRSVVGGGGGGDESNAVLAERRAKRNDLVSGPLKMMAADSVGARRPAAAGDCWPERGAV